MRLRSRDGGASPFKERSEANGDGPHTQGETRLTTNEAPVQSATARPTKELPRPVSSDNRFRLLVLALGLGHLTFAAWTGLRWEHVAADAVLVLLPWVGPRGLAFVRAALPLWITGVLVDNVRYVPLIATIHTGDIRGLDIPLFPPPGAVSWPESLHAPPSVPLHLPCDFP